MNETMSPNGKVPSLLVVGVLPSFKKTRSNNKNQQDTFEALKSTRTEIQTMLAKNKIKTELRSKLPSATKHFIKPGHKIRVY